MVIRNTRSSARPVHPLANLGSQQSQNNGRHLIMLTKQAGQLLQRLVRVNRPHEIQSPAFNLPTTLGATGLQLAKDEIQQRLDDHHSSELEKRTEDHAQALSQVVISNPVVARPPDDDAWQRSDGDCSVGILGGSALDQANHTEQPGATGNQADKSVERHGQEQSQGPVRLWGAVDG